MRKIILIILLCFFCPTSFAVSFIKLAGGMGAYQNTRYKDNDIIPSGSGGNFSFNKSFGERRIGFGVGASSYSLSGKLYIDDIKPTLSMSVKSFDFLFYGIVTNSLLLRLGVSSIDVKQKIDEELNEAQKKAVKKEWGFYESKSFTAPFVGIQYDLFNLGKMARIFTDIDYKFLSSDTSMASIGLGFVLFF